jgi:hypothetical protein
MKESHPEPLDRVLVGDGEVGADPGFKWDDDNCSRQVKDDGHAGNPERQKKQQKKDANEAPAVMRRFADDKAGPEQKDRGDP